MAWFLCRALRSTVRLSRRAKRGKTTNIRSQGSRTKRVREKPIDTHLATRDTPYDE